MTNVLSELFGKIAEAIRDMNPNAGTMKPAEFPEKIRTISGGSGGSGVPSGPALRMASGEFRPDTAETVLSFSTKPFTQHQTYLDYYCWEDSPAAFVLTEGATYAVTFSGLFRNLIAEKHSRLCGVNDCIVLGNANLLTGGSGEPFLILYSESENKSVVFSKYHSPEIPIGIIRPTPAKVTIEHGLGEIPDFILVYYNSADITGNSIAYPAQTTALWGLKSTFSEYSDILSAYSGYGSSGKNSAYGLDNMDYSGRNSGYIYCDDDNTFTLGDVSDDMVNGNLMANQTYRWIAMTGLGGYVAGGSSSDVRYVTFMNHDGTVTYGKIPVAVGYDCPNPKFDTPKRESDVQYNYSFFGWATEPNGGADENWNKSITEDKTVYANFAATLRTYTITYYDGDGTSILYSEPLLYGDMPDYVPNRRPGYSFEGWEPELSTVVGDANYRALWAEGVTFSGSTWEDIIRVCEEGKAAETFYIGDTRIIPITHTDGNTYDIEFSIVGINHDTKEDGTKAGISLLSKHAQYLPKITGTFDDVTKRWGGWTNSGQRAKLNDASHIAKVFPAELIEYIKPVIKKSSAPSTPSSLTETVDLIWVPSIHEYGLAFADTASGQGSAYAGVSTREQRVAYGQRLGVVEDGDGLYVTHGSRSESTLGWCVSIMGGSLGGTQTGYASASGTVHYARIGFCI